MVTGPRGFRAKVTKSGTRIVANHANPREWNEVLVIVEKELSHQIVAGFFATYNELRYGLPEHLDRSAFTQLRTYLAASGLELGILLHFGPTAEFHRQVRTTKKRIQIRADSPDS